MGKEILISIRPEFVEKILNGKKTIEIRKTMPKCELPCKVYIYCTQSKKWIGLESYKREQRVVAEFTLNDVVKFDIESLIFLNKHEELMEKAQIGEMSLRKYLGNKIGYSWGIDNLIVYDTPKELSEFSHYIPNNKCPQKECGIDCQDCKNYDEEHETCLALYYSHWQIKRPPRSWCYVTEERRVE